MAIVPKKTIDLNNLTEDELLNSRICDLPLTIAGSWLEGCVAQLHAELSAKGLAFHPECYLADEWLTPTEQPIIGIPFYLAHPVLIRLEKKMMMEAEGETKDWCMQLLRHETGHAVTYAYRLNQKRRWQKIFGLSSQEYPETYRFRPYSKSYVRHLDGFYAQYHPDEDFTETFAVWLTPGSDWAHKYAGWPVLEKLEYVDSLMKSIQGQPPVVSRGRKYWGLKSLKITLRNFYKKKHELRAEDFPDFHDGNLIRIFAKGYQQAKTSYPAAELLKRFQDEIVDEVAFWSGEKKYVVHDLWKKIYKRSRQLKLMCQENEAAVVVKITSYMTALVMNYHYTGWYRGVSKNA